MTDRVYSLAVVLSENIRTDDVVPLVQAIGMLKGVADVELYVADPMSHMAEVRAKQELSRKIMDLLVI